MKNWLLSKCRPTLNAFLAIPDLAHCPRAEDRLWLDGGSSFWSWVARQLGWVEVAGTSKYIGGRNVNLVRITAAGRRAIEDLS